MIQHWWDDLPGDVTLVFIAIFAVVALGSGIFGYWWDRRKK